MSPGVALAVGIGIGLVAAHFLIEPSSCCKRVGAGVRDEVVDRFGEGAGAVGDALDLWDYTPGLLDLFGVD